MTSQWFLWNVIDIQKALYFMESTIADRALYPFLFSIYPSSFYPEIYQHHPVLSSLWKNTILHSSVKGAQKRIMRASLIATVVVLAGLISLFFLVEDSHLLPNQNRLSPLLGGMVVRYSWRDTLISQCWKCKRNRIYRRVGLDDIFDHLCRV